MLGGAQTAPARPAVADSALMPEPAEMENSTEKYPRPGWGVRHPDLTAVLGVEEPAAVMEQTWGIGQAVRLAAYTGIAELPTEIVTSIRCIVRVGDEIVVCKNRDGFSHVWPGGRREPGETHAETACREVMEETGWTLDPATLELLGWLHMETLEPQPADHPFPHPDFLQYVYTGRAAAGAAGRNPEWTDTDGYEVSSCLMSIDEAIDRLPDDPLAVVFLRLLKRNS